MSIFEDLHYGRFQNEGRIQKDAQGQPMFGSAVCDALGLEPEGKTYTPRELMRGVNQFQEMALDARSFIQTALQGRAQQHNLKLIDEVISHLALSSTSTILVNLQHSNFNRATVEHLASLGETMQPYNNEVVFSQSDIELLLEKLDELIQSVFSSDLESRIKDRMIQTLGAVRIQLLRINLVGPNEIIDGLDMYFGQITRAYANSDTPEKKGKLADLLTKSLAMMKWVQDFTETGTKLYPMLESVTKRAIEWVTGDKTL